VALRLVVFDIDGTLVDSQALIFAGFVVAFAAVGRAAPERRAVMSQVGQSLPEAMRQAMPAATQVELDTAIAAYRAHYLEQRSRQGAAAVPLFSGARTAIEALAARPEVLIGAATGLARRGLDHVLAVHGLDHHFVTRQSADGHPSKPAPSMLHAALAETGVDRERAVMVGDTTFDIEMAQNAGMAAIGVTWGNHPPEALHAAGAAEVIAEFAALIPALDRIWGQG
jgi:phosphoglycolate phosphatase